MDLLVLNAITQELQNILITARITRIYQPADLLLILSLQKQGQVYHLVISADPSYPCIYLQQRAPNNLPGTTDENQHFIKSLKYHLQGGYVEDIHKPLLERVVHIEVYKKEPDGSKTSLQLIVEIMGRHSNIILVDKASGKILDSIKHVTAAMTSYRRIVPGVPYIPPPEQEKLDPQTLTQEDFIKILQTKPSEKPLWQYILDTFKGFSPLMAREVQDHPDPERVWSSFERIMKALKSGPYEPVLITCFHPQEKKSRSYLSPIPLVQFSQDQVQIQNFPSISQAAEAYYSETLVQYRLQVLRSSLLQILHQRLAKKEKKHKQLEEELVQAEKAQEFKKLGELITANLSVLKKGAAEVEVVDFYDPDQKKIKIKLDPRLTPSQNAQKYFHQYTKLKRSLPILQERLASVHQEITYLKELQFFVEEATSWEELEKLKEEVKGEEKRENGRKGKPKTSRSSASPPSSPFRRFISSDGFPIWVGRSSRENDLLTLKFATPEDVWLHAQGVPGSHVLILNRTRSESIPERTLEEAAALAAYYSKGRGLGKVPVDYTLKKYVRKPKGSPPGLVTLIKHKTILAIPRKEV
jgi:predicted ribosome quality control (RQC) complex YloA/Tae2 family protein